MSKQRRVERRKAQVAQNRQHRLIQIGTLVFIVAFVGFIVFSTFPQSSGLEQPVDRLELDPILGNPDAPITVVEYAAYGCSACKVWHEAGIMEQILQEFPDQLRFIYRDMPVILPAWSQEMAEVAQCALDQSNSSFWLIHNALFSQTIQGRSSQAEAIGLGASLGLDVNALQACVDANTHYETVRYDMNRPEARNVLGTPTWFVNGQVIFNASPAVLRQTIIDELANLD
jgi:protein-disulfide isomerase